MEQVEGDAECEERAATSPISYPRRLSRKYEERQHHTWHKSTEDGGRLPAGRVLMDVGWPSVGLNPGRNNVASYLRQALSGLNAAHAKVAAVPAFRYADAYGAVVGPAYGSR